MDSNSSMPAPGGTGKQDRLFRYLRTNWLAIFSAFVLGLGFPLWRMYVYEAADIRVEVTEVDKKSDPVKIELAKDPVFKALVERRAPSLLSLLNVAASNVPTVRQVEFDELDRMIESQTEDIDPLEKKLVDHRRLLDELRGKQQLDSSLVARINRPLSPEERIEPEIFQPRDEKAISELKERLDSRLTKEIASQEASISEKRRNLEAARANLAKRREQAELRDSRVYIKCAISNSGAGAISMKPQAFLRVYLGGKNYVDIELSMELYDEKGDLQPRSSRIVAFRSDPIAKLRESDQEKINTYFKQNVPGVLFVIDINGRVYRSNTVPFAKGLYQQTVYDRLRTEASLREAPEVR